MSHCTCHRGVAKCLPSGKSPVLSLTMSETREENFHAFIHSLIQRRPLITYSQERPGNVTGAAASTGRRNVSRPFLESSCHHSWGQNMEEEEEEVTLGMEKNLPS